MKTKFEQAKNMVQGYDNFTPPADIADLPEGATSRTLDPVTRCFRDLCLFEYCINPLKQISLHDYEMCVKRLSYG